MEASRVGALGPSTLAVRVIRAVGPRPVEVAVAAIVEVVIVIVVAVRAGLPLAFAGTALAVALVPFALGVVDLPIVALTRLGEWPVDVLEYLVQAKVVSDGALMTDISDGKRRIRDLGSPSRHPWGALGSTQTFPRLLRKYPSASAADWGYRKLQGERAWGTSDWGACLARDRAATTS